MLNPNHLALDLTPQSGIAPACKHVHEHGSSLCHLLDEIDDPLGIDALCDLFNEFEKPAPQPEAIVTALRDIERVLAGQTPSSLDRLGRERNFYAADATRWHGARVSELLAGFAREV